MAGRSSARGGGRRSGKSTPRRAKGAAHPAKGAARPAEGAARPAKSPARGAAPARGRAAARSAAPASRGAPSQRGERASHERERDRGLGGQQVEGRQAVRELLIAGRRKVREIWLSNDLDRTDIIADIVDLADDQRVQIVGVSRKKLDAEARSEAPQGVLAKAAPLEETDLAVLTRARPGRPPFLVAVDGVTDPGNLGALLRSAEGAGVHGVVLPSHRAVHVTPTVAKAAAGAIEHVPMALVPGLPVALSAMRKVGIWVVGLDDEADRSLFELGDLAREGICLVMGAEGAGLSRLVRERCDMIVSIPMHGHVSSLNVSAAAALACYEVARQRALA